MGTSVLAMPIIVMPGAGAELYRGLGSVVVGGLALSTLITLVLTPLAFSYVIELVLKLQRALGLAEVVVSSTPSEDFDFVLARIDPKCLAHFFA